MIVDDYRIYWKYEAIGPFYLGDKQKRKDKNTIRIECFIVTKEDNTQLSHAWVQPHHSDVYDKEKGRKIALTRALRSLTTEFFLQDKGREFRRKVWEAYRTMSPIPKW